MYDDTCRFRRHRMGRKNRGKAQVRDTFSVGETHVQDGLRKPLSPQKRNEVNNLVKNLLAGK